jgi:signal transduction histidine kinase
MTFSLRTRVLLGAVLWTIGLVLLSFVIIAAVFRHAPDLPILGRRGSIHFIWVSHTLLILVTAVISMLGGAFQVRRGLAGISQLRSRLGAVHGGREARLGGEYVPEVQPLVDDLNALIEQREQAVRRAVAKAGDLAHGLKTPLALLAREAERAGDAGQAELASAIGEQVERMRRQINYHLAHARAAASGSTGGRASVDESAQGLARTMRRLHADRQLTIEVRASAADDVRVQREDLDEMLGNLLDNACKWARSRVLLTAVRSDEVMTITVDDDGPGLAPGMRDKVLQRGVRADEQATGSGLGLAIVRDLAEVYQGSIVLSDSTLGGLRATLNLPMSG